MRSLFGADVVISSVVKGNAYGHGIAPFVTMAHRAGIEHFSVFSGHEAQIVYDTLGEQVEIMVMGFMSDSQLAWAVEEGISFFVSDFERLEKAIQFGHDLGHRPKLHIDLDTGMNRTGFSPEHLHQLIHLLKDHIDSLELSGLCTHFAGAESIGNFPRIEKQKRRFQRIAKLFKEWGLNVEREHTCCSAAAIRFPEMRRDLVRIGIMQYGFWPSREVQVDYLRSRRKLSENPLKRVLSWRTEVMGLQEVKAGEYVGYGNSYLANSDTVIATIPVGYSSGFSRALSNTGRVIIHGQRVPVIGTVNMNLAMIDVSDLETIKIGDSVTLIGVDGELELSVSSFSEYSDQLNYELLTRLPESIPRTVEA